MPSAEAQRISRESIARSYLRGSIAASAAQAGARGCSRLPGMMARPEPFRAANRRLRALPQRDGLTPAAAGMALRMSRPSSAVSAGSSCGLYPSTRQTVRSADAISPRRRRSGSAASRASSTVARLAAAGSRKGLRSTFVRAIS
jgi:hypothetical protein